MEDERAPPPRSLQTLLANELRERTPDRDQAAAVAGGKVAFGWEAIARLPLPAVECGAQVEIDLVVQRDGTELEAEAGHLR
jgi:hypothetical protein